MILLFILFKLLSRVRIKPARRRLTRTVTTRTVQRDAEKLRREQFKQAQAAADLVHYTQVKRDLLTAYNASGAASGDTEKAIRKRIAYDNAIRRTEKQIENAAYNARRPGI